MPKFRKKPVVIEAVRMPMCTDYAGEIQPIIDLMGPIPIYNFTDKGIIIETIEGNHLASWGDWIIKGVEGELYPCKPHIFKKTYEPVD